MTVTKVEAVAKKRFRVYLEEEFAFTLYQSELYRYEIQEGSVLEDSAIRIIKEDLLLPRIKEKAVSLLMFQDRTVQELKERLRRADYTDDLIQEALAYVDSYGYIDDERFTDTFIRVKSSGKSRRQIEMELTRKGIDRQAVRLAMEENSFDEESSLRSLAEKRLAGKGPFTPQELNKHYAFFARKGYDFSLIQKVVKDYQQTS